MCIDMVVGKGKVPLHTSESGMLEVWENLGRLDQKHMSRARWPSDICFAGHALRAYLLVILHVGQ